MAWGSGVDQTAHDAPVRGAAGAAVARGTVGAGDAVARGTVGAGDAVAGDAAGLRASVSHERMALGAPRYRRPPS